MPHNAFRQQTIDELKQRFGEIPDEIDANQELIDMYERANEDLDREMRDAELEIERLQELQDEPEPEA